METNVAIPRPTVYFSPSAGCTGAVIAAVATARSRIVVAAYEFTSTGIASALLATKRIGVAVQVILDPSQRYQHGSQSGLLTVNNIPVLYDPAHHIFHDKYMVIDSPLVLTGSFNLTPTSEFHNAETPIFVDSPQIAAPSPPICPRT
jgi:phosphatidylserine/phosphatidylglycerophosphate/cardiolipin synthase-like enzyme